MNEESSVQDPVSPILYVRPSCPECDDALGFFAKHGITFHKKDVSRDPIALLEMQHKSRQGAAPVLDWHGRLLAKFGLDQLKSFLHEQNVTLATDNQPAA
jgi:arsenate reductase-like glutaredoxin family protein